MQEVWVPVSGYDGRYEVSNLGRIRSYAQNRVNGKIKTGHLTAKGYRSIPLYDGKGNKKWYPIHRLVAQEFIENPLNLPQVNHKDENKENNRVDNLEWCTNEYNMRYGTRSERVSMANRCCETTSKKVYSIDDAGTVAYYDSIGEAARQTGLWHANIVRALKGKRPRCGGRRWFYRQDPKVTPPATTERNGTER